MNLLVPCLCTGVPLRLLLAYTEILLLGSVDFVSAVSWLDGVPTCISGGIDFNCGNITKERCRVNYTQRFLNILMLPVYFLKTNIFRPSHLLGGTTGRAAASLMYRGSPVVEDLSEQLSIILAAMDPDMWQVYRQAYVAMSSLFPLRNMDPRAGIQCFVGHFLLINMPTTIHFDKGNPPDGWAAMVVLGEFTGNPNLCVPEIGVAI